MKIRISTRGMLNSWPDNEQEAEKNKQRAVGDIDYINKGIAITHDLLYPVSIKYGGQPEDDAYRQSKKH